MAGLEEWEVVDAPKLKKTVSNQQKKSQAYKEKIEGDFSIQKNPKLNRYRDIHLHKVSHYNITNWQKSSIASSFLAITQKICGKCRIDISDKI